MSFHTFTARMLEVTGPAFVKLGHWLAIRGALFLTEFCIVLCARRQALFCSLLDLSLLCCVPKITNPTSVKEKPRSPSAQWVKHGVVSDNEEGGDESSPSNSSMGSCKDSFCKIPKYLSMPSCRSLWDALF